MDIKEAFEQSLAEFDMKDFDSTSDDIPAETVDKTEDEEPEDGESEFEEVSDDEKGTEDEEPNDGNVLEIKPNAKLKLPDGTIVSAEKAVLMQSDYTRKTQELAEQRKAFESDKSKFEEQKQEVSSTYEQMRDWYESRVSAPSDWIVEIASNTEDATATVAKALYEMSQAGVLDPQFVETFGIDSGEVAEIAGRSKVEDELAELRSWRESQENEVVQREAVRQRAAAYEQEWEQVKLQRGLDFNSKLNELDVKKELFQFAFENRITQSLLDAYDLMTVRKPQSTPVQGGKNPSPEVVAKKRASRAVTPKSAGENNPKRAKISDRDAILAAMEDVGL